MELNVLGGVSSHKIDTIVKDENNTFLIYLEKLSSKPLEFITVDQQEFREHGFALIDIKNIMDLCG